MQTPVREQVLQALFAALGAGLDGDGGVQVATLERNRRPPAQAWPAVLQIDADGDEELLEEVHIDRIACDLTIEIQVSGPEDEDLGPAQSELEARVTRALYAAASLGGLIENMTRSGWSRRMERDASPPVAASSLRLKVEYFTKPGDPFSPGA